MDLYCSYDPARCCFFLLATDGTTHHGHSIFKKGKAHFSEGFMKNCYSFLSTFLPSIKRIITDNRNLYILFKNRLYDWAENENGMVDDEKSFAAERLLSVLNIDNTTIWYANSSPHTDTIQRLLEKKTCTTQFWEGEMDDFWTS